MTEQQLMAEYRKQLRQVRLHGDDISHAMVVREAYDEFVTLVQLSAEERIMSVNDETDLGKDMDARGGKVGNGGRLKRRKRGSRKRSIFGMGIGRIKAKKHILHPELQVLGSGGTERSAPVGAVRRLSNSLTNYVSATTGIGQMDEHDSVETDSRHSRMLAPKVNT